MRSWEQSLQGFCPFRELAGIVDLLVLKKMWRGEGGIRVPSDVQHRCHLGTSFSSKDISIEKHEREKGRARCDF